MFEIQDSANEVRFIDFGRDGRVLFKLPVLGDPGVPMILQTSVALMVEAFQGGTPSDSKMASLWSMFVEAIGNSYPNALVHLGRLDKDQLRDAMMHWFKESNKLTEFSPKAS